MSKNAAKTHTRFGTPLSSGWDEAWSALVEETEIRLSRRICGGRTLDGAVCTLFSNHPSGRCRFHGGVDGIGASPGNRNAELHGLYSRRLQDCGTHCPRFERCPLAGSDVAELPAADRPACPYERVEYDASVEDLAARMDRVMEGDAYGDQYAHHIALLQVMVGRAARALASSNDRPTLDAYLRLSAEYRRALRLAPLPVRAEQSAPEQELCIADIMRPILKQADGVMEDALEFERNRKRKLAEKKARSEEPES